MSVKPLPNNPFVPLDRMFRALEVFRGTNPAPAVQTLEAFLVVAANTEPMTQADVAKALGIAAGQASGHLGKLAENARFGEGMGLIEIEVDRDDARRRLHKLSKRGRTVAAAMVHAMRGKED